MGAYANTTCRSFTSRSAGLDASSCATFSDHLGRDQRGSRDADPVAVDLDRNGPAKELNRNDEPTRVLRDEHDTFDAAQRSFLDPHALSRLHEGPRFRVEAGLDYPLNGLDLMGGHGEQATAVADDADTPGAVTIFPAASPGR